MWLWWYDEEELIRFHNAMKMKILPIGLLFATLLLGACSKEAAKNPDPNHTHADFAIWVNGQKLDFSDARYMSEAPTPTSMLPRLIPAAFAHEGEDDEKVNPDRKYLHLHDGNGHVVHRHKPDLTIGDFFHSLGMTMTSSCFALDDFQFQHLDQGWVRDFARTKNLCDNGKFHWTMILNGNVVSMNAGYVFADGDKILLSYGSSDTAPQEQYAKMTNDACLYSKTCPERGEPPTENCIADPTVPCVAPN
jgi:hypothetical protein